jgi:hypothetical protein
MNEHLRVFITPGLLLSLLLFTPVTALPQQQERQFAGDVRAAVARLGTGASARVEVRLRDKTKIKGYVSGADENGFVVVSEKTGVATQVMYPQVGKVKGNNLSTGEKILLVWFVVAMTATIIGMATKKPRPSRMH